MSTKVDPEVKEYLRRLKYRRKITGPAIDMRPRVKREARLDKILHQHSDGKKRNFFISSHDTDPSKIRDITKEPSPYWFPPDNQIDSYRTLRKECEERQKKEESKLPVFKKLSYRQRQTADLLERLRIPVDDGPKPTDSRPKTILDIDPEYFSIVEGRPTRALRGRSARDFVLDIRELLKTKLQIGYIIDETLLIDEQFREERQNLNRLTKMLDSFVIIFEDFLADDHAKSMALLRQVDQEAARSRELQEDINLAVRNIGVIKTQVFLNEDRWTLCKKYRDFLFKVSPMNWRLKYDFVHFGQQQQQQQQQQEEQQAKEEEEFSEETEPTRDLDVHSESEIHMISPITSLEQIIALFTKEEQEPEPQLYFQESSQLLQIMQSLASKSLASLLHIEQVRVPLEALLAEVEKTKIVVNQELESIRDQIQELENEIEWEEKRLREIRAQFHNIVDKLYTEIMVGSPDVITMLVWVEDLYERCIAPNDSHLTVMQMMTHIEQRLEQELVAMDYLNKKDVSEARHTVYREEERQMKEAQDAQRKIQEFDQLISRMHRAYDIPPELPLRKLMRRSRPPQPKKKKSVAAQELSEEETDRITFFTDQTVLEPLTKFLTDQSLAQDTAQLFRKRIDAGKGMEVAYGKRASALGIAGITDSTGIITCLMRPVVEVIDIEKTPQLAPDEAIKLQAQKSAKKTEDDQPEETAAAESAAEQPEAEPETEAE